MSEGPTREFGKYVKRNLEICAFLHGNGKLTNCGAERDRTDDLRLAKPALSQLSYSPVQPLMLKCVGRSSSGPQPSGLVVDSWARAELNCRPHAYQACALTT